MIESRWKAVMALLGILSAVGTTAFGAGAGLAMYRADQAVLPQRLDAFDERLGGLERRIEQIDTLTAQSATLLRDLVCDLRIERGESPPECIRVFTPQPQAPGG